MILLTKGQKRLTTNSEDIILQEKDILFLTQGNYFMSEVVSSDGIYEALLVYFNDDFIIDFIKKYKILLNDCNVNNIVSFSSDKLLKSLVDSYGLYINKNLEHKNEIIKLKTEEIFLHLLSEKRTSFCSFLKAIELSSKDRIRYILEANSDLIETVDDMCKIARVSKSELRLAMKKSFRLQPKAWLDSKRLEQASVLLLNSNESIGSIATTCGYGTVSWFGVQFKKTYGVTAKAYREQNS
jgi:AraC-like DNA-binding protein